MTASTLAATTGANMQAWGRTRQEQDKKFVYNLAGKHWTDAMKQVTLGFDLGLRPQISVLGLGFGLAFGGLGHGLAGQVVALALADVVKLRYINSNIQLL